jgi:type I restriction enzyme S subunit
MVPEGWKPGYLLYALPRAAEEHGEVDVAVKGKTLNKAKLIDLPLLLPPLPEQRKIAAILSSVDDAIEATQAVIDQLQVVKKAMMAELLTRGLPGRHTRFKMTEIGEIPEEWEVRRIGDLIETSAYGTSAKSEAGGSGFPVLRIPNVVTESITIEDLKYASLNSPLIFSRGRIDTAIAHG